MEILENIPLAQFTTIKLGGPARYLAQCQSINDIPDALEFAERNHVPVHILSGGSNTIFPDAGFPGLVIKLEFAGIDSEVKNGQALVTAQAGENWDQFVAACVEHNWVGVEALSGIPGSVGATPVQNVGAYGQSVGDFISGVQAYDRHTRTFTSFSAAECQFGYRTSRFKTTDADRYIITAVTFALIPNGSPQIKYPELAAVLDGQTSTAVTVRNAVLQIRSGKGMTVSQTSEIHSCGSFFMNPIISVTEFEKIKAKASADVPHFPEPDGRVKIPAGWLIEHAGFTKGERYGGVGISPHHILALVNYTGTTTELIELAQKIVAGVQTKFGVTLNREPVLIKPVGESASSR